MSNRILIVCEGQTELGFCKKVLGPHLGACGLFIDCPVVNTGKIQRGGIVDYQPVKKDLIRYLKQNAGAFVTTMIDFYGLPNSFPGYAHARNLYGAVAQAEFLERSLLDDLRAEPDISRVESRFIPYLQLHEFEALLFSDLSVFSERFSQKVVDLLLKQASSFENPEAINDSPQTAPSKRIIEAARTLDRKKYKKLTDGLPFATKVGLPKMREKCPRFDAWVARLEALTG